MIPIIISSGARSARLKAMYEFEEEKMTDYTPDDLGQDWEFKIVRSGNTFTQAGLPNTAAALVSKVSHSP